MRLLTSVTGNFNLSHLNPAGNSKAQNKVDAQFVGKRWGEAVFSRASGCPWLSDFSTPIDRPNQFATGEILKRFEAISFIHSDGSVDMCF